jgi:serine/threonine-protein kinase
VQEERVIAGKYRIKRRIGAGGMGAVYEGEHVEIGKRVAIKVIEHQHAQSEELASRFKREARAASAVESEHIVQVFDVGRDPELGLYMVMEMLSGEDVASRLEKSGGKLSIEEATTILVQTARALTKAHAAGVVHRDLKPANLFMTTREDGSICIKILDFGISKLQRPDAKDTTSSSLTREGTVIGTPQYMSPEQAQGLAVDARTDVWSLGAVAYELYAGLPAFEPRSTYEQMIVQIVTQKPKPLSQLAPWVPAPIAAVIGDALVHDVDARLPDAATFARRLASAETPGSGVRISPPATNAGIEVTAAAAVPGRSRLYAGIGAAALAVVAIGGFVATRSSSPATSGSGSGLVMTAAPSASASASVAAATIPAPVTSVEPPAEVASVAPKPETKAPPRPAVKAPPAKGSPTQYGGAGVSTAY